MFKFFVTYTLRQLIKIQCIPEDIEIGVWLSGGSREVSAASEHSYFSIFRICLMLLPSSSITLIQD